MRSIDTTFINDLLTGELSPFLSAVKNRPEQLSLAVRSGYVNIYYKGGNLLKITRHKRRGYEFSFDPRYCLHKEDTSAYEAICAFDPYSADTYAANLPRLMREMDTWFAEHPKPERDFQHTLLVSNPEIVDIEYQVGSRMRLDMLAVHGGKLVVIENKFGNGAISGSAGLAKHYEDMCEVLRDTALYAELLGSAVKISEAKHALGLTDHALREADVTGAEILFLLAGYNGKSQAAANETAKMERSVPAKVLLMDADESIIRWDAAGDLFGDPASFRQDVK